MATSGPLISAVAGYVETTGRHLSGLRAFARWSKSEPRLRRYRSVAEVVRACREASPAEQDAIVGALLAVASDDPLAQLAVAFLGSTGKLFYLHINDNYRDWDWDLVPEVVNFWEYLESVLYLKRVGYSGWMTADVFPGRNDPVRTFERTFEWMDFICTLADRVDEKELFARMNTDDAFGMLDYVRECTGGSFPAK